MVGKLEQVALYIVGGVIGVAGGVIFLSLNIHHFEDDHRGVLLTLSAILGMLIAGILVEFKESKLMRINDELRNDTVATITHEMRTGLTTTGWAIQYILETYTNKLTLKDQKMLKEVYDSIHTTISHSVNLLDVSVLDIRKLSISLQWVELKEVRTLMKSIVDKFAVGAHEKKITFSTSIKLDPERQAEIDMLRLRIIVENLLENAVQFVVGENKKINFTVENNDTDLIITVRDNGIGIPKNEQFKIFREFFRATNARKHLSTGTGIGLHLCAQYVKAHRGTIRFESEESKGTTFFVTIPLKTVADVKEFLEKV